MSAGLCLGVLVGNVALLWVWVQIPAWYRSGSADVGSYAALQQVWLGAAALSVVLLLTNAAVLRWATLPLALPHLEHAGPVDTAQFWKHHLVFWLCVVFHLACLAFATWLAYRSMSKGWQ
ncbi:hypothetical protein BXP70_05420 [Hymenobacter crusticola]|uniref:DUF4149 domain-containing protein n=1 Tax=Hymenobacter crusticola TaxID=1770526 RepID=A0A243WIR3_9BACT|nr:hypothetical protein BXP70_05420 [Hymenobacter crusticola]